MEDDSALVLLLLVAASNMFGRGIGERKIKPILDAEPNILMDPGSEEDKYMRLIKIKGIGQENAKSFTQNIEKFMSFLKECGLENKLTEQPKTEEPKNVDRSHPLYDKHIVMSGVRDATIKSSMEKVGGIVDESIGKNTFILIVNSKDEKETSKTKYAKEHNIDIMKPAEFLAKYFE
jgi:NAD-dependent DNA ligase